MIRYREVASTQPEFGAAYKLIASEIDPEFLEPEDYVRARLHEQEHITEAANGSHPTPHGYRVHMFAAIEDDINLVTGAVYGSFIPRIGNEERGFGLVSYLAVASSHRGMGIARTLLQRFLDAIRKDALDHIGKPAFGLLFEIEKQDKPEIEQLVKKLGGYPLDIDYYQPSVREGCDEQPMHLWLLPLEHRIESPREARQVKYPAELIHRVVKSLFEYAYPGPTRAGFRSDSTPYHALVRSLAGRAEVGFRVDPTL